MTDQDIMPFGKWKGRTMERVPAGYLLWYYDKCYDETGKEGPGAGIYGDVFEYARDNHSHLAQEASDYICKHSPSSR